MDVMPLDQPYKRVYLKYFLFVVFPIYFLYVLGIVGRNKFCFLYMEARR